MKLYKQIVALLVLLHFYEASKQDGDFSVKAEYHHPSGHLVRLVANNQNQVQFTFRHAFRSIPEESAYGITRLSKILAGIPGLC